MMKSKLLKIIFTLLIITNVSFGQKATPCLINNEMFILPGKWECIGKIENSVQWAFTDKKQKQTLLINVRKIEMFEFYNKELTDWEFLNKFYVWETDFWGKDDANIEIEKMETNEQEEYIIWRLKVKDKNVESFIFSGIRNNNLIGISLSDNDKIKLKNREEKIEFLKTIYFNKEKL